MNINKKRFLSQFLSIWPELRPWKDEIYLIHGIDVNEPETPEEVAEQIIDSKDLGKTKFVGIACTEALTYANYEKWSKVVALVKNHIDYRDLFLWTGAISSEKTADEWNKKHRLPDIKILSSHYHESTFLYNDWEIDTARTYEIKDKNKLLLSFNNLPREHRLLITNEMFKHDLIDKSYYSFEGGGFNLNTFISSLTQDRYQELVRNKNRFPLKLNFMLDDSDAGKFLVDDFKYYNDSYFSLVTESTFFKPQNFTTGHHYYRTDDYVFITEKTFKPIFGLHPFILVGGDGYLQELRRLGYKTFDPYINESYDQEPDDFKRLDLIVKEILRLSKFTSEQWTEWQSQIKPLVEHNLQTFYSRTDFRVTKDALEAFSR